MEISVTAWGPTREAAIQFLADIKVAGTDKDGNLIPIADVQITPHQPGDEITVWEIKPEYGTDGKVITPGVKAPGFFWNMRFYGKSAQTLTHGLPQTDDKGQQLSLFERTHILDLVSMRTKRSPEWKATQAPVKPGYEVPETGCRCFDPATIKTPVRVFA